MKSHLCKFVPFFHHTTRNVYFRVIRFVPHCYSAFEFLGFLILHRSNGADFFFRSPVRYNPASF